MRTLLLLAFLLFAPIRATKPLNNAQMGGTSQEVVVLQVNAKWNRQHNINLNSLVGCDVQFAWLEEQHEEFKRQIQTVPIIVVYHNNKPIRQWSADLSFSLDVDLNEIQSVVNTL